MQDRDRGPIGIGNLRPTGNSPSRRHLTPQFLLFAEPFGSVSLIIRPSRGFVKRIYKIVARRTKNML